MFEIVNALKRSSNKATEGTGSSQAATNPAVTGVPASASDNSSWPPRTLRQFSNSWAHLPSCQSNTFFADCPSCLVRPIKVDQHPSRFPSKNFLRVDKCSKKNPNKSSKNFLYVDSYRCHSYIHHGPTGPHPGPRPVACGSLQMHPSHGGARRPSSGPIGPQPRDLRAGSMELWRFFRWYPITMGLWMFMVYITIVHRC